MSDFFKEFNSEQEQKIDYQFKSQTQSKPNFSSNNNNYGDFQNSDNQNKEHDDYMQTIEIQNTTAQNAQMQNNENDIQENNENHETQNEIENDIYEEQQEKDQSQQNEIQNYKLESGDYEFMKEAILKKNNNVIEISAFFKIGQEYQLFQKIIQPEEDGQNIKLEQQYIKVITFQSEEENEESLRNSNVNYILKRFVIICNNGFHFQCDDDENLKFLELQNIKHNYQTNSIEFQCFNDDYEYQFDQNIMTKNNDTLQIEDFQKFIESIS
ncbi:hypothetical protein TTHERM_00456930 (macronuclear) [Tetrahymena thermophila SB210]|uniref:Uncharacterized protein n=1 Tax=Tetrahymena thermophila (strain SB210) TaxID=312017 RepID=I7LX86_TETTS|nr:hypothetical protein TTHERM_00456930 [Tetrahymena thermophila SB210]EAS03955.1 hypothetical protein TTHERM_00456930 [Tetrahymena thermophila SB210]|eukprot:XP_001024200.1 hypothetical protein TTHERM_00456930 [Tetrahymena thermophila SB210]